MSLADLSARIYTIKSRKNVPFSSAFVSMIREDLSLRYSMFNIVKSLTGSEILAQVAEAKYGFKTPLQKSEDQTNKKRAEKEKKFKQFTADSLVTLNNKINTLAALTQRNTTLIENLYNDLGSFRNQKRFTKQDMNSSASRIPIRSRTVKFQIDQLKAELTALQMMTIGPNKTKAIKKKAKSESGLGAAAAGGFGAAAALSGDAESGATDGKDGNDGRGGEGDSDSSSGIVMGALDAITTYLFGKQLLDWWKTRKVPTPTAIKPTPLPAGTAPRGTGVVDTKTGKFISAKELERRRMLQSSSATTSPSTATKAGGVALRGLGVLSRLFSAPVQGAAFGGYAMYDLLTGKTAGNIRQNYEKIMESYGLKFIKGPGGTTIGYEIDGVTYTPDTLPQEYKNILDAIGPDRRAAAAARSIIESDEATYRMLETAEGRKLVLPPPPVEITDPMLKAAIAGRVALSIPEPQMISAGKVEVTAPTINVGGSSQRSPKPTSVAASSTPPPVPSIPPPSPPANVSGMPIDFASYAKRIGMLESTNNYSAVNSLGYLGKYQFGALALQDVGLVKKGTSLKGLDNPDNWNIEGGKQAFLSNPKLQEQTFIKYTTMNYRTLQRIGVLSVESPPDQVAGFLAASHLLGPGGARDLMRGKVNTDAYGTKSSKYYVEGIETQRTYMAAIMAPPKLEYASGASVSTLPMVAAATAAPSASSIEAEVNASAALASNRIIQNTVVALGGKIADLDKQMSLDRQFPSVRNASLA
jgi:hypothetical protein